MNVSIGHRTDVGRARDGNEDSYLVQPPLFVVADGMGGHLAGEVASQTAIRVITDQYESDPASAGSRLAAYVQEANRSIHARSEESPDLSGMGTTCTLLFLDGTDAHFVHVGDSRAYLFRQGEISQITEDHTLVERMVKEGRIQRNEAARHPQRNVITRALGLDEDVSVDTVDIVVRSGDRLLLCSDGLNSMLDDDEIRSLLETGPDAQTTADRLVEKANEAGGDDNITVIVVDVGREDTAVPPPPPTSDTNAGDRVLPHTEVEDDRPRRSWLKRLFIVALIIGLVAGAGFFAARYALDHSYFVGATDDGTIAIFKGIPDEFAGLTLRSEEEVSEITVEDLPENLRDNVEEGIKVDSLEEGRTTLANLEERAADIAPDQTQPKDQASPGGGGNNN
jgi:PPM family protein phosphatase